MSADAPTSRRAEPAARGMNLNRTTARVAVVYFALGVAASAVALKVAHLQARQWITALLWFGGAIIAAGSVPAMTAAVRRRRQQDPTNTAHLHEQHEKDLNR